MVLSKRFSDQINFLGRANYPDGNVGVEPTHLDLAGKSLRRDQQKLPDAMSGSFCFWSGRWELNPRLNLGRVVYYHCTTPANSSFYLCYGTGVVKPVVMPLYDTRKITIP